MKLLSILILQSQSGFESVVASECKRPLASSSYSAEKMNGFWYEIARMQTEGGAKFQIGSVCTGFDFKPFGDGARVDYTSRKWEPEGRYANITGRLYPNEEMLPGNFYQRFPWDEEPGVSWNIIYLDDKWAIEYDCYSDDNGKIEYCVHFEHRTPEYNQDELDNLIDWVNELELNEFNRDLHIENQNNCW